MKKCPYCAEEIQDEAIKCKHCGSDLAVQPEVASPAPVQYQAPVPAQASAYCRRCGYPRAADHSVVCMSCGSPTGSGTAFCPVCGGRTGAEAGVCTSCNVVLDGRIEFARFRDAIPPRQVSAGGMAVCSLLIPGLGQMIMGQVMKGVAFLLAILFTVGLAWLLLVVIAPIDAYLIGKKLNAGQPVGQWEFF